MGPPIEAPGILAAKTYDAPSVALAADKETFGASRVHRWFGRDWAPVG